MVSTAFRVDARRGIAQRQSRGPDARRLTGSGVLSRSGARDTTWLLRHLRAFCGLLPKGADGCGAQHIAVLTAGSAKASPQPLAGMFHNTATLMLRGHLRVLHRLAGALVLYRSLGMLSAHG